MCRPLYFSTNLKLIEFRFTKTFGDFSLFAQPCRTWKLVYVVDADGWYLYETLLNWCIWSKNKNWYPSFSCLCQFALLAKVYIEKAIKWLPKLLHHFNHRTLPSSSSSPAKTTVIWNRKQQYSFPYDSLSCSKDEFLSPIPVVQVTDNHLQIKCG